MSAYRSILPQRTRSIEAEDLKRAPRLSLYAYNPADLESLNGDVDAWNRMVPFLPETLQRLYEDSFQTEVKLEVHFLCRHEDTSVENFFAINVEPYCSSEKKFYHEDFFGSVKFMNGRKLEREGSSFEVAPNLRGQGLGKAWLKSMVELTLALGGDNLKFRASSENGAYTWGKAGVPMDMAPEYADGRINLSRMVIGRLEAVRPYLSSSEYGKARALSRFIMKDDVNRLAAMDTVVPPDVLDDLRKYDSSIHSRLMEYCALHLSPVKPKLWAASDKIHLTAAFESAEKQKKELSLPRFLLSGAAWDACVDFSNAGEMQTIGAYLGGWKTIMPKSRDRDLALQL